MGIFQKSVIQKHLGNLEKERVKKAFQKFRENYSLAKIEKIKELKEEEYQDGFLRDVFVDVLGYILKPDDNYNLAREFKNQGDGKKADGAILNPDNKSGEKALAVIELKSTKTKDLKSITEQAFNYKNNQPDCKYVITSNFQKLRFYIDYANEFEEFDLFHLQRTDFDLLFLLLNSNSIFSDLPLKLKEETKFHEQDISDKLYKDYSIFKNRLFENLIKNNPENNKLILFNKSQKLLDRFLFILFAEDSGLLPPNSISRIVKRYEVLKEEDAYKPIYDIYKQYFGYMNIGRKGKTAAGNIPAYNGGLFYPDDLLDKLKIDDEILIGDLLKLSEYDFNTEVDVNILGHIFEHSLSEIEEITAELSASKGQAPVGLSKRKKDGVFYTPKYITQYIVENTIGTLCNEKRKALEIEEIEFDGTYRTKDGNLSVKGKKLYQKLNDYKDWLLSLKIVDPACGSGAFLNQALNFLILEHKNIDDIIAELTNTTLRLFDTEKSILENNLFGVDINEESVEIAKLSLWLRTAHKDRKLSNLNNNIKCGNSLIDDPEVAGDKAFDWNVEFPQVFRKKEKKAWHITTATHNSRYSQRMFDNHVKRGDPVWLSEKEEEIVTRKIAEIVKEGKLNVIEYNICGDHMHIILVCEKEEVSVIMQKLKSMSARACNIAMGRTIPIAGSITATNPTAEHAPQLSSEQTAKSAVEHAPPLLRARGTTQAHLWARKSGNREISNEEDLHNVINYIRTNRQKHELPENKKLNKIIDTMTCSVEHAFRTEYNGGFDVVIGNPPYVSHDRVDNKKFLADNYESHQGFADLYCYFYELGFKMLKTNGILSFITSNSFLKAEYGAPLRNYLLKNSTLLEIINIEDTQIFSDAIVNSSILSVIKNKDRNDKCLIVNKKYEVNIDFWSYIESNKFYYNQKDFDELPWNLIRTEVLKLRNKIKGNNSTLEELETKIRLGLATGSNAAFIIPEELKKELIFKDEKSSELIKPMLRGKDIERYYYNIPPLYLLLTKNGVDVKNDYPAIYEHLDSFGDTFKKRGAKGQHWTNLRACSFFDDFKKKKIVWIELTDKGRFSKCIDEVYLINSAYFLLPPQGFSIGYLLVLLNSKLIKFYLKQIANTSGVGTTRWINIYVKEFPIFKASIEQQIECGKTESLISKNLLRHNQISISFFKYIQSQLGTDKLSKKLQNWHEIKFSDFIAELNKAIKKAKGEKLTKKDEMEWMELFEEKKAEAQTLKTEIEKTDKEIDQMVYELYGLSDEEIIIIENSIN